MKCETNQSVKHRITGFFVVLAIATIFLPGLMKQSNKRLDASMQVSMKLPNKPAAPRLDIPSEKTLFKSVKVTNLTIPKPAEPTANTVSIKAEPLSVPVKAIETPMISELRVIEMPTASKPVVVAAVVKPQMKPKAPVIQPVKKQTAVTKKSIYAVQLGSFLQQTNAKSLVARLQQQGYKASYNKSTSQQGVVYKVVVGQLNQRDAAILLQKKLASNLQLNGMIVKREVG